MQEKIVKYEDGNMLILAADSKEMLNGIQVPENKDIKAVVVCFTKSNKNGRRARMRDTAKSIIKGVFGKRQLPTSRYVEAVVTIGDHEYATMMILSGDTAKFSRIGSDIIFPTLKEMLV